MITGKLLSFLQAGIYDASLVLLKNEIFHQDIKQLSHLRVFWEVDLRSDVVALEAAGGALPRRDTPSCLG